jgi:hypothetical protein
LRIGGELLYARLEQYLNGRVELENAAVNAKS